MFPFWNCPSLWHHDCGGWRLTFCRPTRRGGAGGGIGGFRFHLSFVCVLLVCAKFGLGGHRPLHCTELFFKARDSHGMQACVLWACPQKQYFRKSSICALCPRLPSNSIAFGSAPRGEADSQPISQLDRPAVSQTETHTLGFLSVADTGPRSGENNCSQVGSARMVMQAAAEVLVGGSNPGAAAGVHRPGFERPTKSSAAGCITIRPEGDVT